MDPSLRDSASGSLLVIFHNRAAAYCSAQLKQGTCLTRLNYNKKTSPAEAPSGDVFFGNFVFLFEHTATLNPLFVNLRNRQLPFLHLFFQELTALSANFLLPVNPLLLQHRVTDHLRAIQILTVHVNCSDLMPGIRRIVINSLLCVPA